MTHYIQNKSINDVLYGCIEISRLALQIIDTPEFQALRQLKQLGCVHYVYPSAVHTRFEHSIGVYHLAGVLVSNILKNQPELSGVSTELIKIAGLVHDIGHSIFSHLFDNHIAKMYGLPDHEERSAMLFRYVVKTYDIPLQNDDVNLIVALIRGKVVDGYPKWIFEIVSNSKTQLDVDKCDYLVRDAYHLGMPSHLQVERIFRFVRVINDHLCFHQKVYLQIADVFMARYRQHKEVYQHRVVLAIELLIVDILKLMYEIEHWGVLFDSDHTWRFVTDSMLDNIPRYYSGKDEREWKALELYKRLHSRDFYRNINTSVISTSGIPRENTEGEEIVELTSVLGFSNSLSENPMNNIMFYNNEKEDSFHMKEDEVSDLLSSKFVETKKLLYSKAHREKRLIVKEMERII